MNLTIGTRVRILHKNATDRHGDYHSALLYRTSDSNGAYITDMPPHHIYSITDTNGTDSAELSPLDSDYCSRGCSWVEKSLLVSVCAFKLGTSDG